MCDNSVCYSLAAKSKHSRLASISPALCQTTVSRKFNLIPLSLLTHAVVVSPGTIDVCKDPHMTGLRRQSFTWTGVDGGLYCLPRDAVADLHINVRTTAPRPVDFPRN